MALNNTQLRYYDANVLRLPGDKRKEYNAQVDRLIDNLRANIRDKTQIKITKVVKAGSFAATAGSTASATAARRTPVRPARSSSSTTASLPTPTSAPSFA